MGGKHKQAQRVKNNARPSNSGRSAELLGTSINPFLGFSSVKETSSTSNATGFVFNASSFEDVDSNLDVKFQLVLKKMNKKDGTTKLKALQEFTELVKVTEPEAVKAVLPFWPRIYSCLVVDVEHRVREATHFAHHAVVTKVKRNLAPHLKQLAGPWFTSQYDTYPPAATAAIASFEAAFPNKIQDVITFCQEEILQYICDNICAQSVETIISTKKLSMEEAEAKYERLLISSLQGYTLYLNKMPVESLQAAKEINQRIVSNNKFWKLVKVKVPLIRSAWFGCITALCQKAPFLFENQSQHAVSAVFSNLDENEPTVISATWEAALLIVTNIKDWHKHVNIEKCALPKLWKVLKEGGQGNATVVFPNLLPLLSQFPISLHCSNIYNNFFTYMQEGIKKQSVIQSKSEFSAIITAFVECMRYIIMKNVSNQEDCIKLINEQLFSLIDWCIINKNVTTKYLFTEITNLLQYWCKNCETEDFINYKHYIKCFWNSIERNFYKSLFEDNLDKDILLQVANKQINLLLCLKRNNSQKKKEKVSFVDNNAKQESISQVNPSVDPVINLYLEDLHKLVNILCNFYIRIIKQYHCNTINIVQTLVQEFESIDLFKYLNEQNISDKNKTDSLIYVYKNIFEELLLDENTSSESVVDIVLILCKYLNPDEKYIILSSLSELPVKNCLFWTAKKAIHHPYCDDKTVQDWFKTEMLTNLLVTIASTILTNEITTDEMLFLKHALNQNTSGDSFVNETAYKSIISILCDAILSPKEYPESIDKCASFAAYIASVIYTEKTLLKYGDQLILALFAISCSHNFEKDSINSDTLWEVNTAWQDVLSIFTTKEGVSSELQNIIWKLTKIIHNNFFNDNLNDDEHLITAIVDLIKTLISNNNDIKIVSSIIKSVLIAPVQIRSSLSEINIHCVCAELLNGNISWIDSSPISVQIMQNKLENTDILNYLKWHKIVIRVIESFYSKEETIVEDIDNSTEKDITCLSESTEDIDNLIISSLYCYASVKCFSENFNNTKINKQIESNLIEMKDICCKFVNNILIGTNFYNTICNKILNNIVDYVNFMWTKYVYILITDLNIIRDNKINIYKNLVKPKNINVSEVISIQFTQLFASELSYENIIDITGRLQKIIIARSMIRHEDNDVQIAEILSLLLSLKVKDESALLYNRNISSASWIEIQTVVEILRLLTSIIKHKSSCFSSKHWDFFIISLAAWSNSLEKTKINYSNIGVAMFITAFCELYSTFYRFISNSELINLEKYSDYNFIDDYNKIFAEDVNFAIINTLIYLSETELLQQEDFSLHKLPFLVKVGNVIIDLKSEYLIKSKRSNWQKILEISCELLQSSINVLQLWGYHFLKQACENFSSIDVISQHAPHGILLPKLEKTLTSIQDVVHAMLMDFKLGEDTCIVEPYTDSYRFSLGYLLLWDVLITLCQFASTDLRYQYMDWLRSGIYIKELLNNIFRLMPTEVLHCTDIKKKAMADLFSTDPSLSISVEATSEYLEHFVCWVYSRSLLHVPALVRQWWTDSDPRVAHTVDQVTTCYVSPQLCILELQDVMKKEKQSKHNMKIKVHMSSREVIAVYTVDEACMELIITLPANYPLGSVQVDCSRQIGSTSQWRNWVMQLTMFLTHQNGGVWDGLTLWKNNLDKKFDGVEECYICFSVLHNVTYQLPKLVCQTCKKKFHSTCLYKWFSTSNKSTCPICRNLF